MYVIQPTLNIYFQVQYQTFQVQPTPLFGPITPVTKSFPTRLQTEDNHHPSTVYAGANLNVPIKFISHVNYPPKQSNKIASKTITEREVFEGLEVYAGANLDAPQCNTKGVFYAPTIHPVIKNNIQLSWSNNSFSFVEVTTGVKTNINQFDTESVFYRPTIPTQINLCGTGHQFSPCEIKIPVAIDVNFIETDFNYKPPEILNGLITCLIFGLKQTILNEFVSESTQLYQLNTEIDCPHYFNTLVTGVHAFEMNPVITQTQSNVTHKNNIIAELNIIHHQSYEIFQFLTAINCTILSNFDSVVSQRDQVNSGINIPHYQNYSITQNKLNVNQIINTSLISDTSQINTIITGFKNNAYQAQQLTNLIGQVNNYCHTSFNNNLSIYEIITTSFIHNNYQATKIYEFNSRVGHLIITDELVVERAINNIITQFNNQHYNIRLNSELKQTINNPINTGVINSIIHKKNVINTGKYLHYQTPKLILFNELTNNVTQFNFISTPLFLNNVRTELNQKIYQKYKLAQFKTTINNIFLSDKNIPINHIDNILTTFSGEHYNQNFNLTFTSIINNPIITSVISVPSHQALVNTQINITLENKKYLLCTFASELTTPLAPQVLTEFNSFVSVFDIEGIIIEPQQYIIAGGNTVELFDVLFEIDKEQPYWHGKVTLANVTDFKLLAKEDTGTLFLQGMTHQIIFGEKTLSKTSSNTLSFNTDIEIFSVEKKIFDEAWVGVIDTHQKASDICETILGKSIIWDMVDWVIPGGIISSTNTTKGEIINKIVRAGGGFLTVTKDNIIKTTQNLALKQRNIPIITGNEIFNYSLRNRKINGYNSVIVSQYDFDTDNPEYNPEYKAGYLYLYPQPWHEDIELSTTSFPHVKIGHAEVDYFCETEKIEVKAGESQVKYPIYSIISKVYLSHDLGEVIYQAGEKTITTTESYYSILEITYKVRYIRYKIDHQFTKEELTQFLISSNFTPENNSGVRIRCIRGAGDNEMDDIYSPYTTTVEAAKALGDSKLFDEILPYEISYETVFTNEFEIGNPVKIQDDLFIGNGVINSLSLGLDEDLNLTNKSTANIIYE